jgi:SAM-dependent methyltransferase
VTCPLCGSDDTRLHWKGSEHAVSGAAFGSSRTEIAVGDVLRCRDCGFGFGVVRPTADRLGELYREMDTAVYEAESPGRVKTARRHLAILERFHKGAPAKLLEIGCASGNFLKLAVDAGWQVTGVEPSAALCEQARRALGGRVRVIGTTLQTAGLEGERFNAVAMFDVLEHVPDAVEFLARVVGFIEPGGVLLMNLPDLDSPEARILGRRWPLRLPEHLNYFNKTSLERIAHQTGLTKLGWGRRPASFSAGYVMYRLGQHGFPGARLLADTWLARQVVPIYMGELWSAWRSTDARPPG